MVLSSLVATMLFQTLAGEPAPPPGPPQRIVLPIIEPGCDRAGDADVINVCGRTNRRYRIDDSTLSTLRAIEDRDDPAKRPRPNAITQSCADRGPMTDCAGAIPVSAMALKAIGLIAKAIRGEDLRPALRQDPTDYEIYQSKQAEAEEGE